MRRLGVGRDVPGLLEVRGGRIHVLGLAQHWLLVALAMALMAAERLVGGPSPRGDAWPALFAVGAALSLVCWTSRRMSARLDGAGLVHGAWLDLQRRPGALLALHAIALLVSLAALAPLLAPFPNEAVGPFAKVLPPGWVHPLGTDSSGHDLLGRLLWGGRASLGVGLAATLLATVIGTAVGLGAGFLRGLTERILLFLIDLMLALPRLLLLLVIVGLGTAGGCGDYSQSLAWSQLTELALVAAVLGATGWMELARVTCLEVRALHERPFVEAARAQGLDDLVIMGRHVLPHLAGTILVFAALCVGSMVLLESALSFLGCGLSEASWGTQAAQAFQYLLTGNFAQESLAQVGLVVTACGLSIAVTVLAFNVLADGIRAALDPRGWEERP